MEKMENVTQQTDIDSGVVKFHYLDTFDSWKMFPQKT